MYVLCKCLLAGIMLKNEQEVLENMSSSNSNLYFVPLVWAASLVNRARKEGRIKDDFSVKTLIDVRYCRTLYLLHLLLQLLCFIQKIGCLCVFLAQFLEKLISLN